MQQRPGDLDRLTTSLDPKNSLIPKLGIYAVPLDGNASSLSFASRVTAGVIVVAHSTDDGESPGTGLMAGDTICAVNDVAVKSLSDVETALEHVEPGGAVVLQVERHGQFVFLGFELD